MSDKKNYTLTDLSVIKKVMGEHSVTFSKGLGQNFLVNPTVCPRMADAVRESTDKPIGVLEIGAGVGVLTKELLERCEKVVCVELDTRLFPVLEDTLSGYDNLTLINGDILKIDLQQVIKEHFEGMEIFVCANLPYYITSPVIMRLLEEKLPFNKIIVMVQKEAGDRLCARVGSRESGAVTVASYYYTVDNVSAAPELLTFDGRRYGNITYSYNGDGTKDGGVKKLKDTIKTSYAYKAASSPKCYGCYATGTNSGQINILSQQYKNIEQTTTVDVHVRILIIQGTDITAEQLCTIFGI